jgi:hypothetical protein
MTIFENRLLREIKDEISSMYSIRSGDIPTVTSQFEEHLPTFDVNFFRVQLRDTISVGIYQTSTKELDRILNGGSKTDFIVMGYGDEKPAPCLTEKDVAYFWRTARRISLRKGSYIHRHIASQFPSFWNIKSAFRNDSKIDGEDKYLLCSEIPLDTESGKGRVDLVLLRREATSDGVGISECPVLVLDIKSTMGFFWDLGYETKESESRKRAGQPQRIVADFKIKPRSLTTREWNEIIKSTPNKETLDQIDAYSKAIAASYNAQFDNDSLHIIQGTLLIDATDNSKLTRSLIRPFIIKVFESLQNKSRHIKRTVYETDISEGRPRIAIVIHEQEIHSRVRKSVFHPTWKSLYNPLEGADYTKRRFILYLDAASPTSAGKSAGFISKFYHGLQEIYQLARNNPDSEIIWFDFIDDFTKHKLAETRLYLRPRSFSPEDIDYNQPDNVREFFDSILIHGVFDQVESYLFKEDKIPSLQHRLDAIKRKKRIIIISGWDSLRNATPTRYKEKLSKLLGIILNQLPDDKDTIIFWFDSPVPDELNSSCYSTRTLLPFYENSPLFGEVNEIIWNLPVAPENEADPDTWTLPVIPGSPFFDDIRVIINQRLDGYKIELTLIPLLLGWSAKFRSEGLSKNPETRLHNISQIIPDSETRARMKVLALTLIPWLVELYPNAIVEINGRNYNISNLLREITLRLHYPKAELNITSREIEEALSTESNLLKRVAFCPWGIKGAKSYTNITEGRINSQRLYRGPNKLKTKLKLVSETLVKPSESEVEMTLWFGQFISYSEEDPPVDWVVIEDPNNPGRMLVGLFIGGQGHTSEGYQWSETSMRQIPKNLPKDIFTKPRGTIIIKKLGEELICWRKDITDTSWQLLGNADIISGKGGSVAILRALRMTGLVVENPYPSRWEVPSYLSKRVTTAIKQIVHLYRHTQFTSVKLEVETDGCEISFLEPDLEEVIQKINVKSTGDLISLLLLPSKKARPVYFESHMLIDWNRFTSIDYGPFEIVRSFVETSAPKASKTPIPSRILDLLEYGEEKTMELVLYHDNESCPLVQDKGTTHNACWRLRPGISDKIVIERLFTNPLTAKEIFGLLSSGQIYEKDVKYLIDLHFDPEESSPEFCIFNEDSWMRSLLRKNNIPTKVVPPGTFLIIKKQKWVVSFETQENSVIWTANSDVTGFLFEDTTHEFNLNPLLDFESAFADFIEKITMKIPLSKIANQNELKDQIIQLLKSYGFGKSGPECHLDASLSGQTLKIILKQVGGGKSIILHEDSIELSGDITRTGILEGLTEQVSAGELNVTNQDEFLREVQALLEESGITDTPLDEYQEPQEKEKEQIEVEMKESIDFEEELVAVISEYRQELISNMDVSAHLGNALLQLAQIKYQQGLIEDAISFIDESIEILETSKDGDLIPERRIAIAIVTKCEILVSSKNSSKMKKHIQSLLLKAQNLVMTIESLGRTKEDRLTLERIQKIAEEIGIELDEELSMD